MFPHPNAPDPRPSRWVAALRHSLDVVVAFATLRDPEPPPLIGRDAGLSREPAVRRTRTAHPHRQPLQPPSRARRPGAPPARSQPCLSPLSARREHRSMAPADRA
jgi:hypothetical protein